MIAALDASIGARLKQGVQARFRKQRLDVPACLAAGLVVAILQALQAVESVRIAYIKLV